MAGTMRDEAVKGASWKHGTLTGRGARCRHGTRRI